MINNILKLFNIFIYVWNMFQYGAHLESYRFCKYESYDFTQDTKYY
jgi:hypothetical protein